jgi:hypothetical protein
MDLFNPIVDASRQHSAFRMLLRDSYAAQRAVISNWATGFRDRDGKFVQEFQLSFEPGLWELYVNAALGCWGLVPDMSFSTPDFVVSSPTPLCIEAGIAAPPLGGKPPVGWGIPDIPEDFSDFNLGATLRLCNTFSSKIKRYRDYYSRFAHVAQRPFVIAIGAYDRPLAHFAASRPLLAALYGRYYDEQATPGDASEVVSYKVKVARKSEGVDVPVGLFCDDQYADVSAVFYSALATWGKLSALADDPGAMGVFITIHPSADSIQPEVKKTPASVYTEHILDGAYIVHNPFARHPLPRGVLSHPRLAEVSMSTRGEILTDIPDDFLLARIHFSLRQRDATTPGTL